MNYARAQVFLSASSQRRIPMLTLKIILAPVVIASQLRDLGRAVALADHALAQLVVLSN